MADSALHRPALPVRRLAGGVTSTSLAVKCASTSPSTHRKSIFVTRSVIRGALAPVGSAFVLSVVRVLVWIKLGLCAVSAGVGR